MNDDSNVRICKSDIIYYACTDSIFRKISKNKKLLNNKSDFHILACLMLQIGTKYVMFASPNSIFPLLCDVFRYYPNVSR